MSAPITIIFIIISIIIVSFVFMIKKYPLNEKRLDKQNLFWFSVTLPIILFFTFGLFVWTGYNIRLDEKGFSTFLEISKLPLAILALSPVFGVIISNIHRTIQTDEQIKKTSFKNNMDAFYAHNKYILEGLMDINIINCYSVENKHEKYVSYFKKITGDIECFNKYRVNENVIIKSPKRLFSKMYKKTMN
ncbi:hypothetical protein [Xenorhabdus szentirmaii]|uniref:Uncharacterized protein n=1 Tax=Xenorhabdus szentirmaii DSM 16338 TaxID=1427518 RepID=W1J1H3_9GAMM|nr:hypothetical protein [Xenorhabdus szentirmaii]CDL83893.1 membrane hypothetical protein [Xenorhabdus szentirmaii DSM 16338]